jgi:hypothetical protein
MMEKAGLGHGTEAATADAINAQTASSQGQAAGDTGAGKQIGHAAGQEMFKKVPYLGGALGGAMGSSAEKAMHHPAPAAPAAGQPAQAPVQPVAQPVAPPPTN